MVFADDNLNAEFFLDRVENIVVKGENADYQHFLLFSQCFRKVFHQELLKLRFCE